MHSRKRESHLSGIGIHGRATIIADECFVSCSAQACFGKQFIFWMTTTSVFAKFLKFLCWRKLQSRGIPENTTLVEYFELFSTRLSRCEEVVKALQNGSDFACVEVQEILNDTGMRNAFGTMLSAYAFKRITSQRLVEMANAIIDTASCLVSMSKHFGSEALLEDVVTRTTELVTRYLTKTGISAFPVSKFEVFDCSSLFSDYVTRVSELKQTLQLNMQQLEDMRLTTFMCYNCTEKPAISALLPCGHAFLCADCLSDAADSGLTPKCYICRRDIAKVIRLQYHKSSLS